MCTCKIFFSWMLAAFSEWFLVVVDLNNYHFIISKLCRSVTVPSLLEMSKCCGKCVKLQRTCCLFGILSPWVLAPNRWVKETSSVWRKFLVCFPIHTGFAKFMLIQLYFFLPLWLVTAIMAAVVLEYALSSGMMAVFWFFFFIAIKSSAVQERATDWGLVTLHQNLLSFQHLHGLDQSCAGWV